MKNDRRHESLLRAPPPANPAFMSAYPDGRDFVAPKLNDAAPGTVEFSSHQHGMVGVIKQLIDCMMQELMTGNRSFLAIERMTVETNIAFIEKSMRPGAPIPDSLPDEVTRSMEARLHELTVAQGELSAVQGELSAVQRDLSAAQRSLEDRLSLLDRRVGDEVQWQAERIARVEVILLRLLRVLAPLRWVRRSGISAHHLVRRILAR